MFLLIFCVVVFCCLVAGLLCLIFFVCVGVCGCVWLSLFRVLGFLLCWFCCVDLLIACCVVSVLMRFCSDVLMLCFHFVLFCAIFVFYQFVVSLLCLKRFMRVVFVCSLFNCCYFCVAVCCLIERCVVSVVGFVDVFFHVLCDVLFTILRSYYLFTMCLLYGCFYCMLLLLF